MPTSPSTKASVDPHYALALAAWQQRAGLTNQQAAARLGVSVGTYRHWRDGGRWPGAAARALIEGVLAGGDL